MTQFQKRRGNLPGFLLFLLLLGLVVGAISFWKIMQPETPAPSGVIVHGGGVASSTLERTSDSSEHSLEALDSEFTSLVDRVIPSVVSITTTAAPDRVLRRLHCHQLACGQRRSGGIGSTE